MAFTPININQNNISNFGAGSGVGSSATYKVLNGEKGTNEFTNVGSGTLGFETTNVINKTQSYKFTASLFNDYITTTVTPEKRSKGRENSVSFLYTLDLVGIEAQIYDVATGTVIEKLALTVSTTPQKVNLPFFLKDSATSIELRFVNTHATNTPTIIFDDVEFSDDPFVYKNLIKKDEVYAYGATAGTAITIGATDIPFNTTVTNTSNSWNGSVYTVPFDSTVTLSGTIAYSGLGQRVSLFVNGAEFAIIGQYSNSAYTYSFSYTGKFKKGDTLSLRNTHSSTTLSNAAAAYHNISITAQAESEHIVTPVKSNLSEWMDMGPVTITATTTAPTKGTTSVDRLLCRRVGDSLECRLEYKQTNGGSAGSGDYLFHIPSTFNGEAIQIDTTKVTPYSVVEGSGSSNNSGNIVGNFSYTDGANTNYYGDAIVYDNTSVRFSMRGGYNATTSNNGVIGSTWGGLNVALVGYFAHFTVPIKGWTNEVTILGAMPKKRIAYLKDVKGINTSKPSVAGIQTRDLNTLEGDSSIVTLVGGTTGTNGTANQFIPIKGKFKISAKAPCYSGHRHFIFLHNVTTGVNEILGTSSYTSTPDNQTWSFLDGEINANGTDVYEIRHYITVGTASDGLGVWNNNDLSIYTTVILELIS